MRDAPISVEQGVARIDLTGFEAKTFSLEFCDALEAIFLDLADRHDIQKVILDGSQRGVPNAPVSQPRPSSADAKRMSAVLSRIESFPKPVIALIDGMCLNEGLEFALCAHYRVSSPTARFGFNQISLGSIPCLGGTQRLPRLTGAKTALDMLLNARSISAQAAQQAGLVDQVVDLSLPFDHALIPDTPRPTRSLVSGKDDPLRYQQQMAEAKEAVSSFGLPAAEAIVECVEAAQLLPMETGLALERSQFEHCEHSDEAVALRYAMASERRLVTIAPKVRNTPVTILGAGATEAALVVALLDAGCTVTVQTPDEDRNTLRERISAIYERVVSRGKLVSESAQARLAGLRFMSDGMVSKDALIFDAGRSTVEQIDAAMTDASTLIFSLRTGAGLRSLTEAVGANTQIVGVHFEKSAHVGQAVELLIQPKTQGNTLARATTFLGQIGKFPVLLRNRLDPVSPVLRKTLFDAAEMLLLHGAEPRLIDETLTGFGFRKGPLAFRDEIGLEAGFIKEEQPATDVLLSSGRAGRSDGLGYYRYAKGDPTPRPDGTILWALSDLREQMGIEAKTFSADDVLKLCLGAMMNSGARLVAEGIVEKPSDIDVLSIHNLDFPRRKGGPMRACENMGLFRVSLTMSENAQCAPRLWTVSPLVSELLKNGQGFDGFDQLKQVS